MSLATAPPNQKLAVSKHSTAGINNNHSAKTPAAQFAATNLQQLRVAFAHARLESDSFKLASICHSISTSFSMTRFTDAVDKAAVADLVSGFFADAIISCDDADLADVLESFSTVIIEIGSVLLIQQKLPNLLSALLPIARGSKNNSTISGSSWTLVAGSRRAAIRCLSNLCLKTGSSKNALNLQETTLQVFLDSLMEKRSDNFRNDTLYDKMIVALLKGIQVLINENKNAFAICTPQLCSRLHTLIFSSDSANNGPNHHRRSSGSSWRSWSSVTSNNQPTLHSQAESSDSEFSDSGDSDRYSIEKVKLNALYCLQHLAKAQPKQIYTKLPLFISPPHHQSLFAIMSKPNASTKLKIAASLALQSLISGSAAYLAVAEDMPRPTATQSFTSLSQTLARLVVDMHKGLLGAINAMAAVCADAAVVVGYFKCLVVVIRESPYARLSGGSAGGGNNNKDLRQDCFDAICSYQDISGAFADYDTVQVAMLEVYAALLDAGFQLPNAVTKTRIINLILSAFKSLKPRSNITTTTSSLAITEIENIRLASLETLCAFVRNQFSLVKDDWSAVFEPQILIPFFLENNASSGSTDDGVENKGIQQTSDLVKVACVKFIEQFAAAAVATEVAVAAVAAADAMARKSEPLPVDSKLILKRSEWWSSVLERYICVNAINHGLFAVRALALEVLGHVPADVFETLPQNLQLLCKVGVLKMLDDWNENDLAYIISLASKLPTLAKDKAVLVRVRASWAIANLGDTLLLEGNDQVKSEISDSIHTVLVESAIFSANDNDKCRSNGVRAVGNFLRVIPAEKASTCFSQNLEAELDAIKKNIATGAFKTRWNACYAAYNFFQSPTFASITSNNKDVTNNNNIPAPASIAQLLDSLATALIASKNYKVRINAAMAIGGIAQVEGYIGDGRVGRLVEVLEEACANVDDLGGTSFGEFKYKRDLNRQLRKSLAHLRKLLIISDKSV
ncbi:HEAT repeat-containing protein 6 [Physocladia obscura]|uniref:HEAT repeat-containing protein 6 n=1 Tax=Physocladia obscura TaxID=109957 RepID=A0AAD5T6E2_9FUNG|nr:HEAT repeat-containing protein 6 [Physocladia obscura]